MVELHSVYTYWLVHVMRLHAVSVYLNFRPGPTTLFCLSLYISARSLIFCAIASGLSAGTPRWVPCTSRKTATGVTHDGRVRTHSVLRASAVIRYFCPKPIFLARDSIYAIARSLLTPVRPPVCLSVCHTGGSVKDG